MHTVSSILDLLIQSVTNLVIDWDDPPRVAYDSRVFEDLGFDSLDAVTLCLTIQEIYSTTMPFAELLNIKGDRIDITLQGMAEFIERRLNEL